MNKIIVPDWKSEYIDEHRRGISDMEWARKQPQEINYFIGDIIEFEVGGVGIIDEVQKPRNGWPASYSTEEIEGRPFHAKSKTAWHYEGDFKKLIGKSPLRD
jgi:hypothetical protein